MSNELKDTKDRAWQLKIVISAVKAYEEKTDIKIFEKLFELWQKYRNSGSFVEGLLAAIANLFPGIDEAASFVYLCATCEGERKPSYDDFCDSVGPIEIFEAISHLTDKLKDFMPEDDDRLRRSGAGGESDPTGR
jgi:hypothetical protein